MSRSPRCALALGTAVIMALTLSACSSLFGSRTQSTKLAVGQCVLVPIGTQVDSVTTTECTEEHTGEIYSITAIDRQALPSRDEMDDLVFDTCYNTFEAYVGSTPEETSLDYTAFSPTKATWATGDRDIICIAVPTGDDKLTQSVRNSGM